MTQHTPIAYVIAGSESTGGAGIQADLRTFQELGAYGVGTLTCIVSFDPRNGWAHRFVPVDPQVVADQFEAAVTTHEPSVVKIGMLGTPATIDVVAASLRSRPWEHVVLDPVLICKGQEPGAALDTDTALREQVLPLATIVTPNLFETRTLAGVDRIETLDELVDAARRIRDLGPQYVVAKGGVELPGPDAVDVLVDGDDVHVLRVPKIGEERVSGAGCTFAAAITAEIAKGSAVADAVGVAKDVTTRGVEDRIASNAPFDAVLVGARRASR
ncbi:hydroxymethylpyrimidine/phosphomethylpyrimidine kinase [Cellulosimicrobium arenosum]|uniref:pyridoxal kinase n=1 Tax=Cellulosimicrobium arenosum TaxID=2708133 RepID=A0A927IY43_9MICO|nr:hydroxymethylpyrimidine/phosphomethylpyrimidine kinase [Cellulosimicrobium arenosum]MBD8077515.1 hydroxymethylpyrimidine/phosphomethylpyrimidine kinase [Cellulosimicrobium arenosum]